ncbi:hypothetical protein EVA_02651 [gut metagenome]|uniref:Uncharacterized protein n=1 Tax=gut metagenome TaxID=749906 RepID=J9H0P9_9ZZZZ
MEFFVGALFHIKFYLFRYIYMSKDSNFLASVLYFSLDFDNYLQKVL